MTQSQSKRTRNMILCSLFVSLTAVCAQIAVPLPFTPVQISLASFAVLLSGACLGAKAGFLCQCVYLLAGAVGFPVFTRFSGGIGILFGATGGYLLGYPFSAYLIGFLCEKLRNIRFGTLLSMLCGTLFCYLFGTLWYMLLTKTPFISTLLACVFPFLPGDILKIAAALFLSARLRNKLSLPISSAPKNASKKG